MSFPKRSKKFFAMKSFILFSSPFSLVSCHHCFFLLCGGGSGAVVDGSGSGNGNGSGNGSGSCGGDVVVSTASTVG